MMNNDEQKPRIILKKKYKNLGSKSRYFFISGGRSSGKSFSVATFITWLSFEPGHTILYTRSTMDSAHISIIPELVEKIEILGVQDCFYVTKDSIVNKASGSKIIFKGLRTSQGDQTAKLKSLNGITTWILDEAEELTDESIFNKINLSIRKKGKQNRVILLLNPTTKENWMYEKFFSSEGISPGSNLVNGDTTYIHTTYLDNLEYVDKSFLDEIEKIKLKYPKRYEHEILGGWLDKSEGVIFESYSIEPFDETLPYFYGSDFGYTNDPSTCVRVAIDEKRKRIYVDEIFHQPKLTTTDIVNLYRSKCKPNTLIIADSAEPRLIDEVRMQGINIKAVRKYPGSVLTGITLMQDYEIIVSPGSINIIKELDNYSWNDKKSGVPIDRYNHQLDAIRYVIMTVKNSSKTSASDRFKPLSGR